MPAVLQTCREAIVAKLLPLMMQTWSWAAVACDSFAIGCLSLARDSLLGERGAVVVDVDSEGSKWNRLAGFVYFLLAGPTPEGGAVADVDLGGSALRNRQVRLAACFRHVIGGIGAMVVDEEAGL